VTDSQIKASLARLTDAINAEFDSLDDAARGTVLANLTISLFRTCARDLTEESFDLLVEELDKDDDGEVLH
jgi:Ca2+-binding EF-hand superfamily protein